jgi:FtsP/CotA-like multicopper oxidase with cupredoxin domain
MGSDSDNNNKKIERREFIKLGASGVAVSLTGCATSGATGSSLVDETSEEITTTTGRKGAQEIAIPEVGELIDPATMASETWQDPWLWRPELWPDSNLDLNVIRNPNPGRSPSPGNPAGALFSFNGVSPGPTIRVKSDGELRIRVRNTLGLNVNETQVGPAPDPFELPPNLRDKVCTLVEEQIGIEDPDDPRGCRPQAYPEQVIAVTNPELRPGWSFKGHANGIHATHTTNLHTHGLHVFPQKNPDGSHSDNVFLRILPNADWEARQASDAEELHTLGEHEHVGQLDYKLQLAFDRKGEQMPHPPGTHWYHPHSHGATHNQVASGMAGFLIVEGDVDESVNKAMTGEAWPDPETRSGPFDYRERLIFIQRALFGSADLDAGPRRNNLRFPPFPAASGVQQPAVIRMRPGAVERWRVLNGSVDGAGTKRFMVLDGQFVQRRNRIWRVFVEDDGEDRVRRLEPITQQDFEDAKLHLQQLSFDGITLVSEESGEARHVIRDLAQQNAGTQNPFTSEEEIGLDDYEAQLMGYEEVFKNGESLINSYVRPNEVYLTNANRADVFFKAPIDSGGRVFTILAKEAHIHSDNFQSLLQNRARDPEFRVRRELFDVVVAYIHVDGEPVEGGDFDVQSLNAHLPPVPPLLMPVKADELEVPANEAAQTNVPVGSKRTRTISYSGTGGTDFPIIEVPDEFAAAHPELENLVWAEHDGVKVLLSNLTTTMGINTEFDLEKNAVPGIPRKFSPHDEQRSRVLVNTAEEWVLYNTSMTMWSHTDLEEFPQPGSYNARYVTYPISRAEGQRRYWDDWEFMISTKAADHPFHIHINPAWVLRIDVPDENGELHNVLPEPQWMDAVAIPRNGGRVVFRTRFDDFVGKWVHHCHILLHEDNGMMQVVDCGDRPSGANYNPRSRVASFEMPAADVDAIYPRPSLETMYLQNVRFIDPNEIGYQVYPNFEFEVPDLSRATLQTLTDQSPPERKLGRAGARGKLIKHS